MTYTWRDRPELRRLEAAIWRHWPTRGPEAARAVTAILDAAAEYAYATERHQAELAAVRLEAIAISERTREPAKVTRRRRNALRAALDRAQAKGIAA